jgi:phospholipid-binding lipoprotein MlaA
VAPLWGPTNLRDGVGLAGDSFLSPTIGIAYIKIPNSHRNLLIGGLNSLRIINMRSGMLDTVKSAKEASLDYYSFVKFAHHQRRQAHILRIDPNEIESEDVSDFDDEPFGDEIENE